MRIKAKVARGFREKTVGLIGKRKPYPLLIQTRFGIHTFGLRFPIDVLVLDKQSRIVNLKESLNPNRIFVWHPKHNTVIELPKGTINKLHLSCFQICHIVNHE